MANPLYCAHHLFVDGQEVTDLVIPDGVTAIGRYAFERCSALQSVYIPSSVESIGSYAFEGCFMNTLTVDIVNPIYITYQAFSSYDYTTLYVPRGSKTAYMEANGWKSFYEIIEVKMPWQKDLQTLAMESLPVLTYGDEPYQLPTQTDQGLPLQWGILSDHSVVHFNDFEDWLIVIDRTGEALLTATQQGNEEYEPYYKEFTLTVEKAPLTITAEDCTRLYGEENPELAVRYEGFVYDEDESVLTKKPTTTTTATKYSPAGDYPITVSGAEADNYEITYVDGTLTISDNLAQNNLLSMADIISRGGKQVELPITLTNDQTVVGISFTLRLPQGVEVATDEDGDPIFELNSERMSSKKFSATTMCYEDGSWGFRIASTSSDTTVNGNEGDIVTIMLNIAKGMEDGDYTISLTDNVLSIDRGDHDIQSLPIHDATATLTLNSLIMGDVNGDEEVDLSDAIMVTYYSLNVHPTNFIVAAADMNTDGHIDLSDAIIITYMSLGVYGNDFQMPQRARSVIHREAGQEVEEPEHQVHDAEVHEGLYDHDAAFGEVQSATDEDVYPE